MIACHRDRCPGGIPEAGDHATCIVCGECGTCGGTPAPESHEWAIALGAALMVATLLACVAILGGGW